MKNAKPNPECEGVRELRLAYIEDLLESDQRLRFEAHLARCTGCAGDLDQLRRWVARLGQLKDAFCPQPWEVFDEVRRTAGSGVDICEHVAHCPSCREYEAAFRTSGAERGMPDELWATMQRMMPRQDEVYERLPWSEWFAEMVRSAITAFRMPMMAASAVAVAVLVVVLMHPAKDIRAVTGLSSVKWSQHPKAMKLMSSPKLPSGRFAPGARGESLAILVAFVEGTQPLPQDTVDKIYASLEPTPEMLSRFRIVSPVTIKDAVTDKRVTVDHRDLMLKGLRDVLGVTLVTVITLSGEKDAYGITAEFIDTETGWVLREARMASVPGTELDAHIREAALRVSLTHLGDRAFPTR